jgi:hypothetical protein
MGKSRHVSVAKANIFVVEQAIRARYVEGNILSLFRSVLATNFDDHCAAQAVIRIASRSPHLCRVAAASG